MLGLSKNWRICNAVHRGDLLKVMELLDAGAIPDTSDRHGNPLLVVAASKGFGQILKTLLEAGANPDSYAKESGWVGCVPLHFASCDPSPQMVGLLLDHGAKPDAANAAGETPIDWARQNPNRGTAIIIEELLVEAIGGR